MIWSTFLSLCVSLLHSLCASLLHWSDDKDFGECIYQHTLAEVPIQHSAKCDNPVAKLAQPTVQTGVVQSHNSGGLLTRLSLLEFLSCIHIYSISTLPQKWPLKNTHTLLLTLSGTSEESFTCGQTPCSGGVIFLSSNRDRRHTAVLRATLADPHHKPCRTYCRSGCP